MIEILCACKAAGTAVLVSWPYEGLGAIAAILAVLGVVLNNRRMICCFYLWIVSNFLSGLIHYDAGLWAMLARDVIFIGLALEGIWKWRVAYSDVTTHPPERRHRRVESKADSRKGAEARRDRD